MSGPQFVYSAFSNTASATTPVPTAYTAFSNVASATTPVAQAGVPAAPTNLVATAVTAAQVNLAWTDNAVGETGYAVERSATGAAGFAQIASLPADAAAFVDVALPAGVAPAALSYRVRAFNATGPSAYSNTAVPGVVAPPSGPPAAPSNLTAVAAGQSRIDLAWADNANNETAYEVQRAPSSGGPWTTIATRPPDLGAYADGAVAASTTYFYRVRATNAAGASAYSGTASATTAAPGVVPPPPPDGSRFPGVQVLIAFDSKPTEAPVWTDVSAWTRAFEVTRGRGGELEPVQAGTATVVLDNRTRRFDPSNSAGPYYGKLKKRKRVRIRCTWAGATHDVYTGYAEDWPQRWEGPVESTVALPLADGLAVLATTTVDVGFPEQRAHERIHDLLDEAAWTVGGGWLLGSPAMSVLGATTLLGSPGDRQLSVADSVLAAEPAPGADGQAALQFAQVAEASDRGLLYATRSGAIRFRSRHELLTQRVTPLAVFGDLGIGTAELPYRDLAVEAAGGPHYTRARVQWSAQGQLAATHQDGPAVAEYYPVTLTLDTRLRDGTDADSLARSLVDDYKEPAPRVTVLEHAPALDPAALWPQLLPRDLGDVVEVRRRPPGGGPLFAQRSRVEGVRVRYAAGDRIDTASWAWAWQFSPVPTTAPWILGDPAASTLGTSTRLLY